MQICYECDIVHNDRDCPLCEEKERNNKLKNSIMILNDLSNNDNKAIKAKKKVQIESLEQMIKYLTSGIKEKTLSEIITRFNETKENIEKELGSEAQDDKQKI